MPTKHISETRPLPGMSPEEWDKVRVSKSHAELKAMGCVIEQDVECCKGDGTGCGDHDPDVVAKRTVEDKALKGSLTATDRNNHADAEIRLKAKGLL